MESGSQLGKQTLSIENYKNQKLSSPSESNLQSKLSMKNINESDSIMSIFNKIPEFHQVATG